MSRELVSGLVSDLGEVLEVLLKDQERYQYLRRQVILDTARPQLVGNEQPPQTESEIDTAVDAAIAGEKQ